MNNFVDYNQIVIDKLKGYYDSNSDLIEMMVDKLSMSKSTVYKKLNGSIFFSVEEMVILAKYCGFSLDQVFDVFPGQLQFTFPYFEAQVKGLNDFVDPIGVDMELLKDSSNPYVYYTSSEIPLFHYFLFEELAIFKFFIYEGTTWSTDNQKLRKFNPSELMANRGMLDHMKQMAINYYLVDCDEYWTVTAFDRTLGQIKYFLTSGLTDKEFALKLISQMNELLDSVESMARVGVKKIKYQTDRNFGKFNVYNNEIIHTGTTIYAKSDKTQTVYMTYDHPNYLRSTETKLAEHTEGYFDKLKTKSYRITGGSDVNFYSFFKKIRSKIDTVKQEIDTF